MGSPPLLLTKWEWTDADYEQMGWHDVTVHAFGTSPETYDFLLDIDYILRWDEPDPAEGYYTFWVAPATLVFHNASAVNVHIDAAQGDMQILDLERTDERLTPNGTMTDWQWSSFGVGGHFSLRSTGYTQYIRQSPVRTTTQSLSAAERGGLSFSRGSFKTP